MKKKRPVNNDYLSVKLPITALASITHRLTGVLMFLSLFVLTFILYLSLNSPESFAEVKNFFDNFIIKIFLILIYTGFIFHIFLGIKHMFNDAGYFEELQNSKISTSIFLILSVITSIFIGINIL